MGHNNKKYNSSCNTQLPPFFHPKATFPQLSIGHHFNECLKQALMLSRCHIWNQLLCIFTLNETHAAIRRMMSSSCRSFWEKHFKLTYLSKHSLVPLSNFYSLSIATLHKDINEGSLISPYGKPEKTYFQSKIIRNASHKEHKIDSLMMGEKDL